MKRASNHYGVVQHYRRAARRRPGPSGFRIEALEPRLLLSVSSVSPNLAITTDPGVQQFPSIAADPMEPKHLVMSYMDRSLVTTGYAGIGVAVSHDGGNSWQDSSVPLPAGFNQGAANPITCFDGQGHVFVSFMAATFLGAKPPLTYPNNPNPTDTMPDRADGFQSDNGIFVSRSDDGGATWEVPTAVVKEMYSGQPVFFEANPDMAIDTFHQSPFYGQIYVSWTRYYPIGQFPGQPSSTGGGDTMISVSRDGGRTWQLQTQQVQVNGQTVTVSVIQGSGDEFGIYFGGSFQDDGHLAVGPDGNVYVSNFAGGDFTVEHSTDGGRTFSIPDYSASPVTEVAFGTGYQSFVDNSGLVSDPNQPNRNQFRTNPLPLIVADPTRPGTVYAVEMVRASDATGTIVAEDVNFARSTDSGESWSAPRLLNDNNGGIQATGQNPEDVVSDEGFPQLAVDPQGNLSVIWYDTRRDPANHLLDVFGTISTDGGQTFAPNFRITDQSFDANAGAFTDATGKPSYYLGDDIGLALAGGTAYAAWTDTRAGNQNVEFATFSITPAPVPVDDRFEPNNTPGTATNLGTIVKRHLPKLALPTGDEDWFEFTAASAADLNITANFSDPRLGLHLELWDSTAGHLLAVGAAVPDSTGQLVGQRLSASAQSGVTYLLHVRLTHPNASGVDDQYSLDLESLAADLGTTVYNVGAGQLSPGQETFYLLSVGATGSFSVELSRTSNSGGPLQLQLLTPDPILPPTDLTVLGRAQLPATALSGASVVSSIAVQSGQGLLVGVADEGLASGFALTFTNLDQFSSPLSQSLAFPAGAGPSTVVAADFNGDGIMDLAVADGLTNTLSILIGNGDGTFEAPRQYSIGAYLAPNQIAANERLPLFHRQVVVGDFNRDGIPDLAVTNYDSGDVSVLLGRGDGTFEPQRRFQATNNPAEMTVGDVNGDGNQDLVVIDSPAGSEDSTVAVLLGRGDGTFQPQYTFAAQIGGSYPYSTVALADLNHDGKLDLITSGSNSPIMSVFLGNGDGTFNYVGSFPAGVLGSAILVHDFNGDGIPDVVTPGTDLNNVVLTLGNGDGTFGSPQSFDSGQDTVDVKLADIGSQITLPDGSLGFGPPDGVPDLIVADGGGVGGTISVNGQTGVYVLPGLVNSKHQFAGFGVRHLLSAGPVPQSLTVADFDGDGIPDIAYVDSDAIHVIFGRSHLVAPNDTPQTARNLGTIVHVEEPSLTIVPGREDAYYSLTVPTEAIAGSGDEVIDISGNFQGLIGAGLVMQLLDAGTGQLLGAGANLRVRVTQGQKLLLHVFGLTASDGTRGAGAYTLDVDVLPQLVSVQAPPLLPTSSGTGSANTLVLTFQGDRLDPSVAQDPSNYQVIWLGPDGQPGTVDDVVLPVSIAVYDPSANVDIATGVAYPTAVRQTVTLVFATPLPAGSYLIKLSPTLQSQPFSQDEATLLSAGSGHPLVQLSGGQIVQGASLIQTNLITAGTGSSAPWTAGTPFFTQLHDDLGTLLDAALSQTSDDPTVTEALLQQIVSRVQPTLPLGPAAGNVLLLWLDPPSSRLNAPFGSVRYDQANNLFTNTLADTFVSVAGNVELFATPMPSGHALTLTLEGVSATARGGAVLLGADGQSLLPMTDELRAGQTSFIFETAVAYGPLPGSGSTTIASSNAGTAVTTDVETEAESSLLAPAAVFAANIGTEVPASAALSATPYGSLTVVTSTPSASIAAPVNVEGFVAHQEHTPMHPTVRHSAGPPVEVLRELLQAVVRRVGEWWQVIVQDLLPPAALPPAGNPGPASRPADGPRVQATTPGDLSQTENEAAPSLDANDPTPAATVGQRDNEREASVITTALLRHNSAYRRSGSTGTSARRRRRRRS